LGFFFLFFFLNSLDFYLLFVVVVVVAAFLLPSPIDSLETPRVPHSLPVTPSVKEPKMDKKEEEENSHLAESFGFELYSSSVLFRPGQHK
jgi:hypothetical protein